MIPIERRAEMLCMDALLGSRDVMAIYDSRHVYQGYVEPDTFTTLDRYVLIKRIDSLSKGQTTTGEGADMLRRVRLQVDVLDVRYADMVRYSEMICGVLNENFPSCLDGETYGTSRRGQKVFNVCSLDVILYESAED